MPKQEDVAGSELADSDLARQVALDESIALYTRKEFDEAERILAGILQKHPDYFEALYRYGSLALKTSRPELGLQLMGRALAARPNSAPAHYKLGNGLAALNRFRDAVRSYEQAISLQPDDAKAHAGRGLALLKLGRGEEALASCLRAVALKPALAQAWVSLGRVLDKLRRHAMAAGAFAKAFEIEPHLPAIKGQLLLQKLLCCEWEGCDSLIGDIEADIAAGRFSTLPFVWQGVSNSQRSLQLCAETFQKQFPLSAASASRPKFHNNGKIRIGYVSGEFQTHGASFLLLGVLEHHDQSAFETFAFDNGRHDHSPARKRLDGALNHTINIRDLSDAEAAAVIRDSKIDILVNRNGFFGDERNAVFRLRPSPVQVNYLGFPGTLGASFMDYIIADPIVISSSDRQFYSEKVVHLPNSYQANDREKAIGSRVYSRRECGLPEQGFVFCCFNNTYKILPAIFEVWATILNRVPGSVLWLLEGDIAASANLRKEAKARGLNPGRLIFADRLPLQEHLARHRCADLFLDTLPYNAHRTASDALWSGLPVLTCRGQTFPGRVGASLLSAMHLPELITRNLADYVELAVKLATDPGELVRIRRKVAGNRLTTPLFDTALYTKHIEAAYTAMHQRQCAGLAPDHIVIANA